VVEPVDIPVAVRHLLTYQSTSSARISCGRRAASAVQAQDAMAMSAIEHGCTVRSCGASDTDDGDERQFTAPGDEEISTTSW